MPYAPHVSRSAGRAFRRNTTGSHAPGWLGGRVETLRPSLTAALALGLLLATPPTAGAPAASAVAAVGRALDRRQTTTAGRLLRRHRLQPEALPAALRLALGRQLLRGRRRAEGQALLDALVVEGGPVAPLARLALAGAWESTDPAAALRLLEGLDTPGDEVLAARGAALRVRLLRALERPKAAVDFWKVIAPHAYRGTRSASLMADLLWAAEAQGDEELTARLGEELLRDYPRSRTARARVARRPLPASLLHSARYPPRGGAKALQAALRARADVPAGQRQEHAAAITLLRGVASLQGAAWGQAQLHFDAVLAMPAPVEVHGEALWGRARSLRRRNRDLEAAAAYRSLGRALPTDARAAAALEHAARLSRLNDEDRLADGDLRALSGLAPESSAGVWASWRLAWRALREGRWEAAAAGLAELRARQTDARGWSRGRLGAKALYWEAVARERGGQRSEAQALRRRLVDDTGLSYYGVLALAGRNREDVASPASWAGPGGSLSSTAAAEQALRALGVDPARRAARALLQAGLVHRARHELRELLRADLLTPAEVDALASLHAACGDVSLAYRTLRFRGDFSAWPDESTRGRWELFHPRPFATLVQAAARWEGQDPFLLWAVMRQESGFLPSARSGAGAVGLLQLLPVTGRAMAAEVGAVRWKGPHQLLDPEVNIRLGAHFLARLLRRYDGHLGRALAAYNAGPGYVDRWCERFGGLRPDEWVEEVPIERAQGYVKQVLEAYAVYHHLYGTEGLTAAHAALQAPGARPPEASSQGR